MNFISLTPTISYLTKIGVELVSIVAQQLFPLPLPLPPITQHAQVVRSDFATAYTNEVPVNYEFGFYSNKRQDEGVETS